jgi:hypothetical protein
VKTIKKYKFFVTKTTATVLFFELPISTTKFGAKVVWGKSGLVVNI